MKTHIQLKVILSVNSKQNMYAKLTSRLGA